jgi:hypothetical protein
MRTPLYQNICQILFSLIYLAVYTAVINTVNPTGDLDVAEAILYGMTLGFICDEGIKFWKVGWNYLEFWNAFNSTLYTIMAVSLALRFVALAHSSSTHDEQRRLYNELSYNFLAFAGPMFWIRMMLYLDSFKFFGAMFVVLRVMMKESLIFFALLFVVMAGFFQAFVGMAQVDPDIPLHRNILQGMVNSIMQSPEFDTFQDFAFPFGIILYYVFNFIVMTGKFAFVLFGLILTTISFVEYPHRFVQQRIRRYLWQRHGRVHGHLRAENHAVRPRPRRKCLHPTYVFIQCRYNTCWLIF